MTFSVDTRPRKEEIFIFNTYLFMVAPEDKSLMQHEHNLLDLCAQMVNSLNFSHLKTAHKI